MEKRILFDIGHPAQVHQFKHVYWELINKGWHGLFTVKKKEISIYLLEKYKLPFVIIGENRKGLLNKLFSIPSELHHFYSIVKSFKPDIIASRFSLHSSLIAKLVKIPHIGFADTEHTRLLNMFTVPFVDVKFTANSYWRHLGNNHLRYSGNIELFYLYPSQFKFGGYQSSKTEKNVLLRFVSWNAHHDIGLKGFTIAEKINLVTSLSKFADIYISSEEALPSEIDQYQISIPPEKIHEFMASCDLYIGEGGTMASESACLGVPSIYTNSLTMGYIKEEEKYGLLHHTCNYNKTLEKALEILKDNKSSEKYAEKHKIFLNDKIDVTAFFVWFIENYPDSVRIMKENPDYQYRFK